MTQEEKKEKGFQVKDRRRFTDEGEHRDPEAPGGQPAAPPPATGEGADNKASTEAGTTEEPKTRKDRPTPTQFPEIDFATFVMSMSSSVIIHLGLAPDPVSGETSRELGMAKQTIDILGMLQEKTRGNLTNEEKMLMDSLLYDLRMRYVDEAKK